MEPGITKLIISILKYFYWLALFDQNITKLSPFGYCNHLYWAKLTYIIKKKTAKNIKLVTLCVSSTELICHITISSMIDIKKKC